MLNHPLSQSIPASDLYDRKMAGSFSSPVVGTETRIKADRAPHIRSFDVYPTTILLILLHAFFYSP